MHIDIFTLFPGMFQGPFTESILKRAQERALLSIALHNIRDATTDKHHVVDDYPYGGGAGMVMKPEPIFRAIEAVYQGGPIIYLTPQGRVFNQQIAQELAQEERLTFLCGHYEGVDERVIEHLVTDEISIGDYVLTGGELAAMVVVDAVARLIPGVLTEGSAQEESHSSQMLEYPHYTRPPEFRGWRVPDILLSGHHENIARWRKKEALRRTRQRRPDLFARLDLSSKQDQKLLKELDAEEQG
ncbi:tRNA (guanine37-N1)-methyltransferase [Thermosporothrix hazakensis]|jgi:tRNA (guanine37-N1)-methyltransferase|uniref:tRNA (guanine-N(1)-)-methyltransferase n=2 Tax=Thermosporothrix TaxID=768650 RepID=A0A326UDS6_THEHA|nr:tRNA (guanosine(37)-N1)-methyltransferase TrmD [Thermosporothrix hazakensis]PZW24195.1 tRNA (guanine37-N1)-methyltransferase [Thermosporothrix hazakensis]BBH89641.1 tRNA (guanine-N(1)-)-methyltransferase [Thermosporothrix sp. COM3]GCE47827.1 tRNA (guanine-N(1)-)-methyltransferase [Thermosporothrix hazakensis]